MQASRNFLKSSDSSLAILVESIYNPCMVATRGSQSSHAITPSSRARSLPDFWANVDQSAGTEACWPYKGPTDRDGYGRYMGRAAHREAFAIATGRGPTLFVLHTCDNRPCCQPLHLYEGTQEQNIRDRQERGRSAVGTRNGRFKHGRHVGERIAGTRLRAAGHPELLATESRPARPRPVDQPAAPAPQDIDELFADIARRSR